MTESYRVVYKGGQAELSAKRSRFLGEIRPVSTEEEALAFIAQTRKRYWDARHHCYAYIIGPDKKCARMSDDGEPSQTAGKPMMDILQGAGLTDVCAVVTRYFGGTLLGTGGLVRAYAGAVKEALNQCVLLEKGLGYPFDVTCGYPDSGKVTYLAAQEGIDILGTDYLEHVIFHFLVPASARDRFFKKLTEATSARVNITIGDAVYYGRADGELLLF